MSSRFSHAMRGFPQAVTVATVLALAACQPARAPQADSVAPAAGAAASNANEAAAPAQGFRATGNEPGWLAEVDAAGSRLQVQVDYGETRYEVAAPSAGADGWAGVAGDGTPVKLSIQKIPCQDDMSGHMFQARAMLTVGTRQLHGCGDFVAR